MDIAALSAILEREHHDIDGGLEAFLASAAGPAPDLATLSLALSALRRHIYLEEQFVFPPLRAGGLFAAVLVMLREHGEIWGLVDKLDAGADVDPSAAVVRETCEELIDLLEAHNEKEEPIIYPQADLLLTADAQQRLREFLETGQMPAGWICARA